MTRKKKNLAREFYRLLLDSFFFVWFFFHCLKNTILCHTWAHDWTAWFGVLIFRYGAWHRQIINAVYDTSIRFGLCVNVNSQYFVCVDRWDGHWKMVFNHWNTGSVAVTDCLHYYSWHCFFHTQLAALAIYRLNALVRFTSLLVIIRSNKLCTEIISFVEGGFFFIEMLNISQACSTRITPMAIG